MRGSKPNIPKPRSGPLSGTCGTCPCCLKVAAYRTAGWKASRDKKKRQSEVTDEELDRRALAKPLR